MPGQPLPQFGTLDLPWSVAGPESVAGADWSHFSAVCWVAGRTLYDKLRGGVGNSDDVPIGLIVSAWGGTCIESWAPDDALEACSQPTGQGRLFDAMIAPLARMRLAGVFWYQGESNAGTEQVHTCGALGDAFACMMAALVRAWRAAFSAPDLFFGYVQVSPYTPPLLPGDEANRTALAVLRSSQAAALSLSRTAMVTAIDLGDVDSPYRDVHPRNKAPIGERLAAAAAALVYGLPDSTFKSPAFASAALVPGSVPAAVDVRLDAASAATGLTQRPAPPCPARVDARACRGWELQAADGTWHEARVLSLTDGGVLVVADRGDSFDIVGVRYAWANWPRLSLFSPAGLPALPFMAALINNEV